MTLERLQPPIIKEEVANNYQEVLGIIRNFDLDYVSKLNLFLRYLKGTGETYPDIAALCGTGVTPEGVRERVDQARQNHPKEWFQLLACSNLKLRQKATFLDTEVVELHERGFTWPEIGARLKRTKATINTCANRLRKQNKIPRRRPTQEETEQLDQQVKEMRRKGLRIQKIIEETGEPYTHITHSIARLMARGKVKSRRNLRDNLGQILDYTNEYSENQPGKPINIAQMARDLGLRRNYALRLFDRLGEKHTLPPKLIKNGNRPTNQS